MNESTYVDFVGGPFDGHSQSVAAGLDELASTVALPINDNVFRMLSNENRGPAQLVRSIALYELRGQTYHFLAQRKPSEIKMENWRV